MPEGAFLVMVENLLDWLSWGFIFSVKAPKISEHRNWRAICPKLALSSKIEGQLNERKICTVRLTARTALLKAITSFGDDFPTMN